MEPDTISRVPEDERVVAPRVTFCHFEKVKTAAILSAASREGSPAAAATTATLVRTWVELCDDFRNRGRREIIEQIPSSQALAEYREELKWMIRAARTLLNLVGDPDFPARQLVPEISGKLLQLEDSWESLNNPMTDGEADAILQRAFPDETRPRRPAEGLQCFQGDSQIGSAHV